jgi:hypothetical protein
MRKLHAALLVTVLVAAPAVAGERLTDKGVKDLVAQIDHSRDRFEDALDGEFKDTILRSPTGEVKVDRFLDDFQARIKNLGERLKPDYAASKEVETVLRQGTAIDRYFRQQPAAMKGESEWNRLASELKTLAGAYGADFPLADDAHVRRIGDRELVTTLDEVEKSADRLKKSLDTDLKQDTSVEKTVRDDMVTAADLLSKDAKTLRERVKDGKPSSAEATQLLAQAAKVRAFVTTRQAPAVTSEWSGVNDRLQQVATAYGIKP